jgi:hypothetical protein
MAKCCPIWSHCWREHVTDDRGNGNVLNVKNVDNPVRGSHPMETSPLLGLKHPLLYVRTAINKTLTNTRHTLTAFVSTYAATLATLEVL